MSILINYISFGSDLPNYPAGNYPSGELIRESDKLDSEYSWSECPVLLHKQKRTFIVSSPIDYEFIIDREKEQISATDISLITYDQRGLNSPKPVFQLDYPKFLFWTDVDDVWMEFCDHPMTSYSNNFVATRGWFNLSNWSRMTSIGITMVDETKPVSIKKGDPLFRINFYPSNLNDYINLKKERDNNKLEELFETYFNKSGQSGNNSDRWKPRLFTKTNKEIKCPVAMLFK
tara:strand:- start:696 stop:1391 length:696 start_codon:yes stop_codon:yes gene_type:complete